MADVIVLEFSAPNAVDIYNKVNHILGFDGTSDWEHWPKGMLSHTAGEAGDKLVVVEVWASRADQEEFVRAQLGPAFAQAEAPQPSKVEWLNSVGNAHRH
ncbi:MAG TPA: hypothetical protein VED84_08535 [Acidimicrobiales bacterium]|nr:hypothetical protein [Acidimicrobiales bacterium]